MSEPRTVEFFIVVERFDDGYVNHGGPLYVGRDAAEGELQRIAEHERFRVARVLIEEPGQ